MLRASKTHYTLYGIYEVRVTSFALSFINRCGGFPGALPPGDDLDLLVYLGHHPFISGRAFSSALVGALQTD